ncbi:Transcriptional regulatory protein ompR [Nitrospirillum viridazoti Y2]|nr:response regulator [Nitrospirillum amazonense]EGY02633.1 Transcriptional regulatory protein ompR [Nitrospirillum amazonense Y2]
MDPENSDMPNPSRILIVDDDLGIRTLMAEFLTQHSYIVVTAANAEAMNRELARGQFDLVVLDVMMPGEDGLSACRRLVAAGGPPVIMLSVTGQDVDRIIGLEVGADDYIAKPCNPRELLARIRAVLRRQHGANEGVDIGTSFEFGGWQLNVIRRDLTSPGGTVVILSDGEFRLLKAFAERPQRILTRDQLLELLKGPDTESMDRAIDVQVSRLRRKLGIEGGEELIRTVRHEGYVLVAKVLRR